jgi:hypothetical protein
MCSASNRIKFQNEIARQIDFYRNALWPLLRLFVPWASKTVTKCFKKA